MINEIYVHGISVVWNFRVENPLTEAHDFHAKNESEYPNQTQRGSTIRADIDQVGSLAAKPPDEKTNARKTISEDNFVFSQILENMLPEQTETRRRISQNWKSTDLLVIVSVSSNENLYRMLPRQRRHRIVIVWVQTMSDVQDIHDSTPLTEMKSKGSTTALLWSCPVARSGSW